jgi:DnaJ-class molecular chaperone
VGHVLIVTAAIAGYAVFLLIKPEKRCRKCGGWGARGKRRAYCPRCQGTGKRFRLGARLVHRGAATAYRHARNRITRTGDQP